MRHNFIDQYGHVDSPLHRLDPRTKLALSLLLIVFVIACQRLRMFAAYVPFVLLLIAFSRVPISFYLKRVAWITPVMLLFVIFYLLSDFLGTRSFRLIVDPAKNARAATMLLILTKSYVSILILTLLTSTSRFSDLLWALRRFRLPRVLTTISHLVYTYMFVLVDEAQRMSRAFHSRAPVLRVPHLRFYGQWLGALFLRSLNRADTLYLAMVSRGFNGEFPEGGEHRLKLGDAVAVSVFSLGIAFVKIVWKA